MAISEVVLKYLSVSTTGIASLSVVQDCTLVTHGNSFQILLSAALNSWCTHAKEQKLTDKMHTAWKAFLGQVFSLMKLPPGPPCSVQGEVTSIRNQLKVQFAKDEKSEAEIPEMWQNR